MFERLKKRVVVAATLLLTFCGLQAATDGSDLYVAQVVGGESYTTLRQAFSNVPQGGTVKLLSKVTEGVYFPLAGKSSNVTLDLNGYTLTGDEVKATTSPNAQVVCNAAVALMGGGTLTVVDSSQDQTGNIGASTDGYLFYTTYTESDKTLNLQCGSYVTGPGMPLVKVDDAYVWDWDNWDRESDPSPLYMDIGFTLNISGGEYATNDYVSDRKSLGELPIVMTGGTFGEDPSEFVPVPDFTDPDYIAEAQDNVWVVRQRDYVAQVGNGAKYETLAEAVAAAASDVTASVTITLLKNCSGDGIQIPANKFAADNKALTIDLAGYTYTCNDNPVGSSNTKNQAFQFLKGNNITIKNGTLEVDENVASQFRFVIQNYANLTLDNVKVDGTNLALQNKTCYALSNNNGNTMLTGGTEIKAPQNGVAFDVYYYGNTSYPTVNVTVDNAKINGKIEVCADKGATAPTEGAFGLTLTSGTFTGATLVVDPSAAAPTVTKAADVTVALDSAHPQWKWNDAGTALTKNVFMIGTTAYATLADAVAAAEAGQTIKIYEAGTYTLPNLPKNITIEGAVDGVVFNCAGAAETSICSVPNGATIKNATLNFGKTNYHGFQSAGAMTFDDCVLNGLFFSYGDMTFNRCTFNAPGTAASGIEGENYSMWCYSGNIAYKDCTFNGAGKILNVYNEGNDGGTPWNVSLEGCTFNSSVLNKAPLNVKGTCSKDGKTLQLKYAVTVTGCTNGTPENFPGAGNKIKDGDVYSGYVVSPFVQVDDIQKYTGDGITVTVDNVAAFRTLGMDSDGNYLINDLADLNLFRAMVNGEQPFINKNNFAGKTVKLVNNITFTGVAWTSGIGYGESSNGYPFKGTFDGNGKKITGLEISAESAEYVGFFGSTWGDNETQEYAVVRDLTLENAKVNGRKYVGGVVGKSFFSKIERCSVVSSNVVGAEQVGGVTGFIMSSVVDHCAVVTYSMITASQNRAGGVAGKIQGGTISGCEISANVVVSAAAADSDCGAGAIVSQIYTNQDSATIVDNKIDSVTVKTANVDAFVPVGNFASGSYDASQVTFARNRWTPSTNPDYYDMVINCPEGTTPVRVYNYVVLAKIGTTDYYTYEEAISEAATDLTKIDVVRAYADRLPESYVFVTKGGMVNGGITRAEAKIGDTYYATFEDAITAFQPGNTIKAVNYVDGETTQSNADWKFVETTDGWTLVQKVYVAQIGNMRYESVAEALGAVEDEGEIKLIRDCNVVAEYPLAIGETGYSEASGANRLVISNGKKYTLDLNGKTLTGRINMTHGDMTVKNGTLKASTQALNIYGSKNYEDRNTSYSVLTVNEDVTIEATYGFAIFGGDPNQSYYPLGFGETVNIYGKVNANSPIYVSGNLGMDTYASNISVVPEIESLKTTTGKKVSELMAEYGPKINIYDGAEITATPSGSASDSSQGISLSGCAIVNVMGGTITGAEGIGVKGGVLNVSGGSITGTGAKCDPVLAVSSGTESSGAAISVSTSYNANYPSRINVTGGELVSENNAALLIAHSVKNGTAIQAVNGVSVSITGGTFTGGENEKAVVVEAPLEGEGDLFPSTFIANAENRRPTFSSAVEETWCAADFIPAESTVDGKTTYGVKIGYYVAQIGEKKYETLQEAFNDGGDVKLIHDCPVSAWVTTGTKTINLDLAGHTISVAEGTFDGDAIIAVNHGGTLTITDSSVGQTGTIDSGNVLCAIKMTQNGEDLDTTDDATKCATLVVNGGTIQGYQYGISGNGNAGRGNTSVTVKGGTVKATATPNNGTPHVDSIGIYNPQSGSVTITDGTVEGAMGVYAKSGTISVTGGTINGTATSEQIAEYSAYNNGATCTGAALAIENAGGSYAGITSVSITGGTFNSANGEAVASYAAADKTALTRFVTDGTFNKQIDDYLCALGKSSTQQGENAPWTVGNWDLQIHNLAQLEMFRDMVNGGNTFAGKTVTLVDEIAFTGTAWTSCIGTDSSKFNGTFDGNGKTITGLNISANANYVGLFGAVFGATIKDLTLAKPTVGNSGENYTGALVGGGYARIENCKVTGGSVNGTDQVGGLIGYLGCGYVKNSTVGGVTIAASGDRAGGITGKANIDSEYSIVGNTVKDCTISAANAVDGFASAAGLVGQVMAGANNAWAITDNTIQGNTTTTTGLDSTFVPVGEFRGGNYQDDTLTAGHIVRNSWPTTAPDYYDMYNADKTEYVRIVNYQPVAKIGETEYRSLADALAAAKAAGENVTVEIIKDVILDGTVWTPVEVKSPAKVITVNGNNHSISGLSDMLFASTWAGQSGLVINDLTIKDSKIVNDPDDSKGYVGVGAFVGYPQASETITLNNCHLVDSTVEGGHWTGGLIGVAGGYNGNDGPVFETVTITGCSVEGSTVKGKGSVGAIIGHGAQNVATKVVIAGTTTATGNTIIGATAKKTGILIGTVGATGGSAAWDGQVGGISLDVTERNNTVEVDGSDTPHIAGRIGSDGGTMTITGGTYSVDPTLTSDPTTGTIAPKEHFKVVQNDDQAYVLTPKVYVAIVNNDEHRQYETLQEAINAAQSDETVTLLQNITVDDAEAVAAKQSNVGAVNIKKSLTLDGNGKKITADNFTSEYLTHVINVANDGSDAIAEGITVTIMNLTVDGNNVDKVRHGINAVNATVNLENVIVKNCPCSSLNANNSAVTVMGTSSLAAGDWYAVGADKGGTLTIAGGSVAGLVKCEGATTINITGGTIGTAGEATPALLLDEKATGSINVSAGTFYSAVPEEYCADGYIPRPLGEGDTYGVKEGYYYARIYGGEDGETLLGSYETVQDAVNAATDGQTITIVKTPTSDMTATIPLEKIGLKVDATMTDVSFDGLNKLTAPAEYEIYTLFEGVYAVQSFYAAQNITTGVKYASLAAAFSAATATDTIKLLKNWSECVLLPAETMADEFTMKATLDLNGYSLTGDEYTSWGYGVATAAFVIQNSSYELTIDDSSENCGMLLPGNSESELADYLILIENGTRGVKLNVNGGSYDSSAANLFDISPFYLYTNADTARPRTPNINMTLTISGGVFNGEIPVVNVSGIQDGSMHVKVTKDATADFTEGVLADYSNLALDVELKGGYYAAKPVDSVVAQHFIADPWETDDWYVRELVDNFLVTKDGAEDQVFEKIADALAAAGEGSKITITLLNDAEDLGKVVLPAGVTLDGDGKTISGNSCVYINAAGGTVKNVNFVNIHNAAGKLSAIYADGLSGTAMVTGCSFSDCDWDAIQMTPVANATIEITGNTFADGTTDKIQQQRFVHIQSAKNVDFWATVNNNDMTGDTAQGALEVYYFTDATKINVTGNYISDMDDVCILSNAGDNVIEMVYPMRSQAGVDVDDVLLGVATIKTAYTARFYPTLAAAVAAAQAGDTVTVLADCAGDGIKINKSLTIDFNGKTYTCTGNPTGSSQTKNQVFQLLKDNTITFKNGTVNVTNDVDIAKTFRFIIQDYASLTLEGMTLDASNLALTTTDANGTRTDTYALCVNSGTVLVKDSTLTASTAAGITGYALDTSYNSSYTRPTVTVDGDTVLNGTVSLSGGNIEFKNAKDDAVNGQLAFTWNWDGKNATVTKSVGVDIANLPENYFWKDGTTLTAAVAKIGTTMFDTLAAAVAGANAEDTIEILRAGTYKIPNLPKNVTITAAENTAVAFDCTSAGNICSIPNGVTFKDVTINFGNPGDYHGFQLAGTINMTRCTLNGRFTSYGDMNFTECTFNAPGTEESSVSDADYSMWCYGNDCTFTNCEFNGKGKFLNVYCERNNTAYNITLNGCTFNSTVANKAAVNVKETCNDHGVINMLKYNVTISNCTVNENFPAAAQFNPSEALYVISPLVQVDDRNVAATESGITVTLDGTVVYPKGRPTASVTAMESLPTVAGTTADSAWTFTDTTSAELASSYANWTADFVVTFDKPVAAGTLNLIGSYQAWDNGAWVTMPMSRDIAAGEEIRLLAGANENVTFDKIANVVKSFNCGVINLSPDNKGTTMTVKLVITDGENTFQVATASKEFDTAFVAKIGNVGYFTLGAAIEAAQSGSDKTITLLDNITETLKLPQGVKVITDGFTYVNVTAADRYHLFAENGELVVYPVPQAYVEKNDTPENGLDVEYTFSAFANTKATGCEKTDREIFDAIFNGLTWTSGDAYDMLEAALAEGNTETLTAAEKARAEEILANVGLFSNWNADFVVSFNADIDPGTIELAGQYTAWSDEWVTLSDFSVEKDKEYHLMEFVPGSGGSISYEELLAYVRTFKCGAKNLDPKNNGVKMTVKLILYPVDAPENKIEITGDNTFAEYEFGAGCVAQIGTKYYDTLEEAFKAVEKSETKTITLLRTDSTDVTLPYGVTFDASGAEYKGTISKPAEKSVIFNKSNVYKVYPYPVVSVTAIETLPTVGDRMLETASAFKYVEGGEPFSSWKADFMVTFTGDVPANSLALAGSYAANESGAWVAYPIATAVAKDTPMWLMEKLGQNIIVDEVMTIGTFKCGAYNLQTANNNTKMTVELWLTDPNDDTRTIKVAGGEHTFNTPFVADIENVGYFTLGEALEKAQAGQTVTLDAYANATGLTLKAGVTLDATKATLSGTLLAPEDYMLFENDKVYTVAPYPTVYFGEEDKVAVNGRMLDEAKYFSAYQNKTMTEAAKDAIVNGPFANWIADFEVSADSTIDAGTLTLAGKYGEYSWQSFGVLPAISSSPLALMVTTANKVTYAELATAVQTFSCGLCNLSPENNGKTVTVELRLTDPDDSTRTIVLQSFDYPISTTFAAEIGSTGYLTIEDALTAANAGDTIKLLNDVELAGSLTTVDKELTLDLNGKTATISTGKTLKTDADFTIVDNTTASTMGGVVIDGTVAVTGGTLDISALGYGTSGLVAGKSGSLTISEGATAEMPSVWNGQTANQLQGYNSNFFAGTADGAKVTTDKTYTWDDDGKFWKVDGEVARVYDGETFKESYDTITEAVAAAEAGQTVKVVADANIATMVTVDKSITIELNGKTLSGADDSDTQKLFEVVNDATLTVDGSVDGSTVNGRFNVGRTKDNNGNLVLNGGTYEVGEGETVVHVNGDCTDSDVTITGATVTSETDNGVQFNGAGTFKIEDSTVSGATAIYMKAGELLVTNSTVTATAAAYTEPSPNHDGSNATGDAIVLDSADGYKGDIKLAIGGDSTVTSASGSAIRECITDRAASDTQMIAISGGKFGSASGKDVIKVSEGFNPEDNASISGGYFSAELSNDYCADGLSFVANPDAATGTDYPYAVLSDIYIYNDDATGLEVKIVRSWITSATGLNVAASSATDETIDTALAATQTNGLMAWQNYVLGIANDAKLLVSFGKAADSTASTPKTKVLFDVDFKAPVVNPGVSVKYTLLTSTDGGAWTETVKDSASPEFIVDMPDSGNQTLYFIKVSIDQAN